MGKYHHLSKQCHNYSNNYYIDLKFHRPSGWPVFERHGMMMFLCKLLLDSVQVIPQAFLTCREAQGVVVHPPPGLCSDLWPCPHVSVGETSGDNSGELITKFMWYKNPLEPSLGNTLFHILTDESSTLSTSSCPIYIVFLQAYSHCGKVMPVRPHVLACTETQSLFSRWKWCEEWLWLTSHSKEH